MQDSSVLVALLAMRTLHAKQNGSIAVRGQTALVALNSLGCASTAALCPPGTLTLYSLQSAPPAHNHAQQVLDPQ